MALLPILAFFAEAGTFNAFVVGVTDGDTIKVLHNGQEINIRLYGIDCPEKSQAYGKKAKEFAIDAVAGKIIQMEIKGLDRYGRNIAVISYNSHSLNEELLRAGLAWHYKKYSKDQRYAELEEEARKEKRGLWIENNVIAPWDYRRHK